jgi:hypothetical protein
MKKIYLLLFLFPFALTSCGVLIDLIVPIDKACKIKINKRYIKSSCGLGNGIDFERLVVIKKDLNNLPSDYYIAERFDLHDTLLNRKCRPMKLFFSKNNGSYAWRTDTVNIHVRIGKFGERILYDSLQMSNGINFHIINNSKFYSNRPFQFDKDTWYYFFSRGTKLSGYLYVDEKGRFHSIKRS